MLLRRFIYTVLFVFMIPLYSMAQHVLQGEVVDSESGEPLVGANIVIKEINRGISTNPQGQFQFENLGSAEYTLHITYVGYHDQKVNLKLTDKNEVVEIKMVPSSIEMEKVMITATRTERKIGDLAGQNEVIDKEEVEEFPTTNTDDILQSLANINVNRSWGIFSKNASVTMRGLDAAQGVLILYNGVPLNKTAGGSINWHMISPDRIERIEVIKGPSSALYGNNAMGGVINIITKKSDQRFSGDVRTFGGSYSTLGGKFNLEGNEQISGNNFYWGITGFYRQGDGYVIEPKTVRDSTDVEVYLKEKRIGATMGYAFNDQNQVEVEYSYYDDKRGDGRQVYLEDGGFVKYTTHFVRVNYDGQLGDFKIDGKGYFQDEHYNQFSENINQDGNYKMSDRNQTSRDYGLWVNATRKLGFHNWFTFGLDIKQGFMDASDIFYTSTDTLMREGKVQSYAAFLQDEQRLFNDKLKIIAGLRFDYARFYEGSIYVAEPTANTGFEENVSENYENSNWMALSPKLSLHYEITPAIKSYISASTGFMPPKMDDLISSRKISKGFKKANPELQPQTLTNYEIGFNTKPFHKAQFKTAAYYSLGKDFQYFVATGNYVDGQTELTRENIAAIEIYGAEFFFQYDFTKNLTLKANYTYNSSTITDFDLENYSGDDLTGKMLVEVPWHQAFAGFFWKNRVVNTTVTTNYIGESYAEDQNILIIDDYLTVDIRLYRTIQKNFFVALDVQNIFDKVYIDKKQRLSPGRFILLELAYKF